jgi:hypothetical protein
MLAKELHAAGCDVSQMRKMGKDGKCAVPATMKSGGGNPYSAKPFSEAYVGGITGMTLNFTTTVDATGCVQLTSGQFALALLPPTAAYLVHLVVSSGDPGDLSGNVGAMVAMGLTQTEIERCLGVMVYEALGREEESKEHLEGYRGVMITSEVVIFEPRGNGKLLYKHPGDPLLGARWDAKTALTTPISLGLQEIGAPRLFMMMKSTEAAQKASAKIKQIEVKLPLGNGVYLTPAQIRDQRGDGPGMVESNLQRQVEEAVQKPHQWMQRARESLQQLTESPWNPFQHNKAMQVMEEGSDVCKTAHPDVGKHLQVVFDFYRKETTGARGDAESCKELWRAVGALLHKAEEQIKKVSTPVVKATVTIRGAVRLRQIIPGPMMSNQAAVVPALKRGIAEALGIEPVGSQHIVVQENAISRLQGLNADGPVLSLRIWDKHAEIIREQMDFRENRGLFAFTSPTRQRIEATIKLQVDVDGSSDVVMGGLNNIQAEKAALSRLFEDGHALFAPTKTAEGMAITPTTLMSALQPLNDEEIGQGPYDIRNWHRASETREQRITALNELIQEGSVSMVVSAITEPPGKWVVYMLKEYAIAVNDAVRKGLFDWAGVQEGEDIQERCATALQITLMQIINSEAVKGIYCSADWVTEGHKGTGAGDGDLQVPDSDLEGKPRFLGKVCGRHPFSSVQGGSKAKEVLKTLISNKQMKVAGKAGVGILVPSTLSPLMRTILQCDAAKMPLTQPIQWHDISIEKQDLRDLEREIQRGLREGKPYLWLFASPDTRGMTPIAKLTMEDQKNEHEARTVCTLGPQDVRFQVGTWVFGAIQTLVEAGVLLAQSVNNRTTWRTGWIVVRHDPNMTVMQQYGDQRAIENKLKSVQLGDDQQVENQLLALELERLEARFEEIKQEILLVPGAERQESSFGFTGATFSGDPQVDINVLTHGLAKKSEEHRNATVFCTVHMQGRKVIPVQHGVLLIPSGHELESWGDGDIRFQRWDSTQSIQLLLRAEDNMEAEGASEKQPVDPEAAQNEAGSKADGSESPRSDSAADQSTGPTELARMEYSWPSELTKRPAQDMATAGVAVRELRARESNDPQPLRAVAANASNTYSVEFKAMNATLENEDEWMTKEEATGPITFTIQLAKKASVVGFWLLHGTNGKLFTQVEVKAKDGSQESNLVIIPPKDAGNKPQFFWLQHPIQEKQFELIFNADSAQGTSGFTGLKFVALAGYVSEEGERETKTRKK